MSKQCKNCQTEPKTPLWCEQCEFPTCYSCLKNHEGHTIRFVCQECEDPPDASESTEFCENCEQHLCKGCSDKIHNKGKRAKHLRNGTSA